MIRVRTWFFWWAFLLLHQWVYYLLLFITFLSLVIKRLKVINLLVFRPLLCYVWFLLRFFVISDLFLWTIQLIHIRIELLPIFRHKISSFLLLVFLVIYWQCWLAFLPLLIRFLHDDISDRLDDLPHHGSLGPEGASILYRFGTFFGKVLFLLVKTWYILNIVHEPFSISQFHF